jgi:predicted PurR-regulated permease PerM
VLATTISVVTILVITAYLLADTDRLGRFIGQFIPEQRKQEVDDVFRSLTSVVGGYLRGQLITSVAIGVFTFILLQVLDVKNPLAFAVLAAFADIIPLVGAIIATVPPAAAALQDSATKAVIVLGGLMAYQQFEDRFLVPRVYGRTLNLPPLIVLIAVLAGAELLGIVGVLLALPLTAAGRVFLDYAMNNRDALRLAQADQILAPDMQPVVVKPRRRRRRKRLRKSSPPAPASESTAESEEPPIAEPTKPT